MVEDLFDPRKVKSNDIVNGLARRDIFDSHGLLLIKEGARIREVHYERMRADGLIQEEPQDQNDSAAKKMDINYVSVTSLHGKLDRLRSAFSRLQRDILSEADASLKQELESVVIIFDRLCNENIHQVLGELYLADVSNNRYIKPLYIAASLIELINRYNRHMEKQVIDDEKRRNLVFATLLYNIGLLQSASNSELTAEQKLQLREDYPLHSVGVMQRLGFSDPVSLDAVKHHNKAAINPSLEATMLRTAFIYANLCKRQVVANSSGGILNPGLEFVQMYAQKKLDPVLGGLFLKINGMLPIGSILLFESREKGMIIKGPNENDIASSQFRLLTNKSGVQLKRPGESFYSNKTRLVQKGLTDHHQFAWSTFAAFTMWER